MHFKHVCSKCKKVIAQCRCMDSNKTIEYSICNDCKEKNIGTDTKEKTMIELPMEDK